MFKIEPQGYNQSIQYEKEKKNEDAKKQAKDKKAKKIADRSKAGDGEAKDQAFKEQKIADAKLEKAGAGGVAEMAAIQKTSIPKGSVKS